MSALSTTPTFAPRPALLQVGRPFVNRPLDLLLLGGGLSVLIVAFVATPVGIRALAALGPALPAVFLLCNSAHFGSSTVRLYMKPGAFREFPFLTLVLPILMMIAVALTIAYGSVLGHHLFSLYLTWSPYHYAAQTYGIAVLYCATSGCALDGRGRALLRLSCLVPFLHAFFGTRGTGIEWFVPIELLQGEKALAVRRTAVLVLSIGSFLLPVIAFLFIAARRRGALPLIAMLVVLSNALWWTTLDYVNAFVVATVFHSVQYLVLVVVFHVRDQRAASGNRQGAIPLAATFYLLSLALGYLIFNVCPYAFVAAGFGLVESVLLVGAAINIHHFIVDAYIWRRRRSGPAAVVPA